MCCSNCCDNLDELESERATLAKLKEQGISTTTFAERFVALHNDLLRLYDQDALSVEIYDQTMALFKLANESVAPA